MFRVFKVAGTSMQPTLEPGDYVLSISFFKSLINKRSIVIIFDQYYSFVIKRVVCKEEYTMVLDSDNLKSNSIFCKKPIKIEDVKYLVILNIKNKYVKKIINIINFL